MYVPFVHPQYRDPSLSVLDVHSLAAVVQAEARHAKTASDRDAQKAAQFKADSAMNGVVKVQDRLIQALQAELDMTNRVREATQVPKWGGGEEDAKRSFPLICLRLSQQCEHLRKLCEAWFFSTHLSA